MEDEMLRRARRRLPSYRRSVALRWLLILLPALVLAFMIVLVVQQQRFTEAKENMEELEQYVAELEEQNRFYREAYQLTLDDIRALTEVYGGEGRYERLAGELRAKELGTVLSNLTNGEVHEIRNVGLWEEYQEKGVVNVSCLDRVVVDTVSEEVFLDVSLSGSGNVSVYIDGNFLVNIPADGSQKRLAVRIRTGNHELDLVGEKGTELHRMAFDAADVDLAAVVVDEGPAWKVFDCMEAHSGLRLTDHGAFRLGFTKR